MTQEELIRWERLRRVLEKQDDPELMEDWEKLRAISADLQRERQKAKRQEEPEGSRSLSYHD